jgi:hypothetical protein
MEIKDDERIEKVLYGIETAKMISKNFASWVLPYDIYFTNYGIAFVCLMDTKTSVVKRDIIPGAVGPVAGPIAMKEIKTTLINKEIALSEEKFQGMNLQEMLKERKESFYLPYSEIQTALVKKKRFSKKAMMAFTTSEHRWVSEFPLELLSNAEEAMKLHLISKMVTG